MVEVELKFFHEGEARTIDFFMFSAAKRESESFALGPTTGTGNEKRRTLRKSSLYREYQLACLHCRLVPVVPLVPVASVIPVVPAVLRRPGCPSRSFRPSYPGRPNRPGPSCSKVG